jgi:AcrR family transcriptional regulator
MAHKADKRKIIMQAAEKLFISRQFHEVTTDDIARQAGVGKGTIYRYFQNKDELFFEMATTGLDELCDALRDKIPPGAPFSEQLNAASVQIGSFFERRRQLLQTMQPEGSSAPLFKGQFRDRWIEKRDRLVAALARVVRQGVDEGRVRSDITPEVLANFFLGMLRTRGRALRDAPEPVRRYETVIDLFLHGVAASASSAPTGLL